MPTALVALIQLFIPLNPWVSRACVTIFPLSPALSPFITVLTIKKYKNEVKAIFGFNGHHQQQQEQNLEMPKSSVIQKAAAPSEEQLQLRELTKKLN